MSEENWFEVNRSPPECGDEIKLNPGDGEISFCGGVFVGICPSNCFVVGKVLFEEGFIYLTCLACGKERIIDIEDMSDELYWSYLN
ncbi:MAG: hypothetical protein K9M15_02350 [Candidatus Marinimicrobia bacterium]|nr:hypothetical protein [Candidatus Neomarinimicrobiota bacterium]